MKSIMNIDSVLLELIKSQNNYISGEKIAKSLNISRSSVHKRIQKLKIDGYLIEAETNKGFHLSSPFPYEIIPEQIICFLKNDPIPKIFFAPQTTSTNTIAKDILKTYQDPFIIITRNQIAGRGRMDRSWQMSADQDIAMSFVIPCNISQDLLFSIIRLASLSVCKILNQYSNNQCFIKWPNDIVSYGGKKICGILTESILEDNHIRYIVIGIGININSSELPDYAISLRKLTNKDININQCYAELIDLLITFLKDFPNNQEKIIQEWEALLIWKKEVVSLQYYDQEFIGILKSVDFDGSLILEINKQEHKFLSGDLTNIKLKKHLS